MKVIKALEDLIEEKKAELEVLRQKFDEADANNVYQQSSIAQKIAKCADEMLILEKFLMRIKERQ